MPRRTTRSPAAPTTTLAAALLQVVPAVFTLTGIRTSGGAGEFTGSQFVAANRDAATAIVTSVMESLSRAQTPAESVEIVKVTVSAARRRLMVRMTEQHGAEYRYDRRSLQGGSNMKLSVELKITFRKTVATQARASIKRPTFTSSLATRLNTNLNSRDKAGTVGAQLKSLGSASDKKATKDNKMKNIGVIVVLLIVGGGIMYCICNGYCDAAAEVPKDKDVEMANSVIMTPADGPDTVRQYAEAEPEEDDADPKFKTFIDNLTTNGFFNDKETGEMMEGAVYQARYDRAKNKWDEMTVKAQEADNSM